MSLEKAAKAGFAKAREIYTGKDASKTPISGLPERYKSNNKLHLSVGSTRQSDSFIDWNPGDADQEARYVDRLGKADIEFGKGRVSLTGGVLQAGETLRKSCAQALNCQELACIAAECAYTELGKPNPAPIALADLEKPADHKFCVVADSSSLTKLKGVPIDQLGSIFSMSDDAWVADPWLNVCCRLCNYGVLAEAQLKKWQSKNKRIAWNSGSLGAGWYAPQGEYSKGFMQAKLVLTAAS